MTNRERVLEALDANPEGLCDGCISAMASITPRQQVQQICSRLAGQAFSLRERGCCSRCGKNVLVNKLVTERPSTPGELQHLTSTSVVGGPEWFDETRRALIRALNQIDPSGRGEPFSKRVTRLRNDGVLPANLSSWMLTWTSLRNIVAYEGYTLTKREREICGLIREELDASMPSRLRLQQTSGRQ